MKFDKRHKNSIVSLIIIALLWFAVYGILGSGVDFGAAIISFFTVGFAIIAGCFLLHASLVNRSINPTHFFYNYVGTLNLSLFVVQVVFRISAGDFSFSGDLFFIILTGLIGLSVYFDIYRRQKENINY